MPNPDPVPARTNRAKTHCPQGHEYTPDNLLPADLKRGRRGCKRCHYTRGAEYKRRARARKEER